MVQHGTPHGTIFLNDILFFFIFFHKYCKNLRACVAPTSYYCSIRIFWWYSYRINGKVGCAIWGLKLGDYYWCQQSVAYQVLLKLQTNRSSGPNIHISHCRTVICSANWYSKFISPILHFNIYFNKKLEPHLLSTPLYVHKLILGNRIWMLADYYHDIYGMMILFSKRKRYIFAIKCRATPTMDNTDVLQCHQLIVLRTEKVDNDLYYHYDTATGEHSVSSLLPTELVQ